MSGPLLLATGLAVLAGAVSFASPCVVPLVPGYLAYLTGLVGAEGNGQRRGRVVGAVALFVLGFSAVFMRGQFLIGRAPKSSIRLEGKILAREATGLPCGAYFWRSIASERSGVW